MTAAMMLPQPTFAQGTLAVNESFDSYATNYVPDITVSGKGIAVGEYAERDKGLKFLLGAGEKKAEFAAALEKQFFISFDIKSENRFDGSVNMKNGTTAFSLVNFEDGALKSHNNDTLASVGTKKRNILIGVNILSRKYSIYADKKLICEDYFANSLSMRKTTGIEFAFSSEAGGALVIDNVNIGSGEAQPDRVYPTSEYSDAEMSGDVWAKNVTDSTYMTCDFSKSARINATYNAKDNILEIAADKDGNEYCGFERTGSQDMHLDIQTAAYDSDLLVYEFDLYNESNSSAVQVNFKDRNNNYQILCSLSAGGVLTLGDKRTSVDLKKWHRISIVYDKYEQEFSGYMDGELFADRIASNRDFDYSQILIWRFHVQGSGSGEKFRIDNLRIYGGAAPSDGQTAGGDNTVEISSVHVWENDTEQRAFMADKVGYHMRSSLLYADGEKRKIDMKNANGRLLAPLDMLDTAFKIKADFDPQTGKITLPDGELQLGSSEAVFAGKSVTLCAAPELIDGTVYVPMRSVCEDLLGKTVFYDNTAISGGMLIIGGEQTAAQAEKLDLQKLNDFLFYERPTPERILEDYKKSELAGVHPRLLATKDDFERIKGLVTTDEHMKKWYAQLIGRANGYLDTPAAVYEIRDGMRLWYVCNEVVESVTALSLAYRLTGDERYAERAWADLAAVTEFPNWNPSHHIDVASMAIAYSIGYDWLYDYLTPERRAIMEKGIYSQAFYDYNLSYQSTASPMGNGVIMENNHNAVMNGGAVMMSMAFMDVYPKLASYFISSAVRCTEYTAWHFAPEGSWYEGTSYGIMTLRFYAYELAPLDMILGETFSLREVEGMSTAARVVVTMQCPDGAYKFADHSGSNGVEYDAGVTWFANFYGDSMTPSAWYSTFDINYGEDDTLARTMLWYRPEFADGGDISEKDYFYPATDVVVMHDGWGKNAHGLVGLKGGMPSVDHGHMDIGSFGFFSDGAEWATDMGYEDYNLPRYFAGSFDDAPRWTYYRLRAEAHNCLVINPDERGGFDPNVNADVVWFESAGKGAIAVVDMTDSYGAAKVKNARRGFFYTDDRRSLVVRDEVELTKSAELDWFMITRQKAEIDGKSVILTDKTDSGRKLKLDFAASGDFELSAATPAPLGTSPHPDGMKDNSEYTRIRLVMKAGGGENASITAKLTPMSWELGSAVTDYDKPIDEWSIPEGEMLKNVSLDEIYVNGVSVPLNSDSIRYYYPKDMTAVPEVSAASDEFDVAVENAPSLDGETKITVSEKGRPENKKVYTVKFELLKDTGYPGVREIAPVSISASAEPQPVNNVQNLLDRDTATRWSADMVESVTLDLGGVQSFDKVIMAFFSGTARQYKFKIEVSADCESWSKVFDGESAGGTDGYEAFDIGAQNARYVRITGNNGSNVNTWNSWTEVAVAESVR